MILIWMNWFLDLPNLTSITSIGYSFLNPRSVTLYSLILNIEWWIDIPNLQTVRLFVSFQNVKSKSITSICMNMNEWIDVSRKLADRVKIKTEDSSSTNSSAYNAHSTKSRNKNSCTILLYFCCEQYSLWIILSVSLLSSYFIL